MDPASGDSLSHGNALQSALRALASDEPSKRVQARQELLAMGAGIRPALDANLQQLDSASDPLYQELVRVRDWIDYGVDPRLLTAWFQELDLRTQPKHGNMFPGMNSAIVMAPAFERIAACGERIGPFLCAVATDVQETYSLRVAAVLLILRLHLAAVIPALIGAYREECLRLKAGGAWSVILREPYRGFFLHTLQLTLGALTGERFTEAVLQDISGIQRQGYPDEIYIPEIGEEAARRWESAATRTSLGDRFDQAERLLRTNRGSELGSEAAELETGLLRRTTEVVVVRDLVQLCAEQTPPALFAALSLLIDTHPAVEAQGLDLFNPYSFLSWSMPATPPAVLTDELLDAIFGAIDRGSSQSRALFFRIVASLGSEQGGEGQTAEDRRTLLLARLRSLGQPERLADHVAHMELLHSLGDQPETTAVLDTIDQALKARDQAALQKLCEMLARLEVSAEKRERALELLFRSAEAYPAISVSVLRALSQADKEKFQFNPVLGSPGVKGLIDLNRLVAGADDPSPKRLADAIRRIRDDLLSRLDGTVITSAFVSSAMEICVKAAERFELPDELYDSLMARAMALGITEPATSKISDTRVPSRDPIEAAYFESLGDIQEYTSLDTAAATAARAAAVARRYSLPEEKVFTALTIQADVARVAGRFEQAEVLFRDLQPLLEKNAERTATIRHFQARLLLEQRRWADALDVALATPVPAKSKWRWSELERHRALDARLYEAFCRHRLGQVRRAAAILQELEPAYFKIQNALHYIQVGLEIAAIHTEQGNAEAVAGTFGNIRTFLEKHPEQSLILAQTLSAEADWRMRSGRADEAEALLEQAVGLQAKGGYRNFEGFDTRAENFWRLGQVRLAQAKMAGAGEALANLRNREGVNPLARAYAIRLEAAMQVFEGAILSAIVTLREGLGLLDRAIYPELKIDLCLDLHQMLLSSGFAGEAQDVLARARAIAAAARDPVQTGRVRLADARARERAGDIEESRALYAAIVNEPVEKAEPGDAWHAAAVAMLLLDVKNAGPPEQGITDQVLSHAKQLGDARMRLEVLCGYARFCIAHRLPDTAQSMLERIGGEIRAGVALDLLLEITLLKGMAAELSASFEEAIGHYRRAVHLVEVMRSASLESGGLGSGAFTSVTAPYEQLVRSLVAANQTREAVHFVERAQARLFLEQVHWQQSARHVEGEALQKYLGAQRRLAVLEAGAAGDAQLEIQKLRNELASLKPEIGDQQLTEALFPMFGQPDESWAKLTELLRSEFPEAAGRSERMVLAQYFTTADVTYVFVVRADWEAPKVTEIRRPLNDMRQYVAAHFSLEDSSGNAGHSSVRTLDADEAQREFGPLIAPLLEWTREHDYIYLVPHDVLHYVPLHALRSTDGQPLMMRNPVLYAPSASVLRYCRSRRRAHRGQALILGDSDAAWPLPHARAEALQVADLFGISPYLGEQATKSLLMAKLNQQHEEIGILHFACHGTFHPQQALKSGILMAPEPDQAVASKSASLKGLPADRFLTAEEFFRMELAVDLVTLSACESGINELRPGDELFGLMRALIYAGTPSVLMSLWAVEEISTDVLMTKFYEALTGGQNKAKALQTAQLAVRKMTASEAIEFCEQTLRRLQQAGEIQTLPTIRREIGDLWYRARDYARARTVFEDLMAGTENEQDLASLDAAIARCSRLERKAGQPDPSLPVFDHPFYWAPFVLAGDLH
jgi:CHAT domain-containing protein